MLVILAIARYFTRNQGIRAYLDAFIASSLLALFLFTFVVRTFLIPSISMLPTLQVGDIVLVDELSYRLHPPQRGDIAVFMPPVASDGDAFIKRVIGIPGDHVTIQDGNVTIDGEHVAEPYEDAPPRYNLRIAEYDMIVDGIRLDPSVANIPASSQWQASDKIPQGYYLMLGDNRNESDDSHVWGFAQVHGTYAAGPLAGTARAGFVGRAIAVIWPLSHFHLLPTK